MNIYFQKENISIFQPDGSKNPFLNIFISVLGTCALCLALDCSVLIHGGPLPTVLLVTTEELGPCSPLHYVVPTTMAQDVGVGEEWKSASYLPIRLGTCLPQDM